MSRRWLAIGGVVVVLATVPVLAYRNRSGKDVAVQAESGQPGEVPSVPETLPAGTADMDAEQSTTTVPGTDPTVAAAGRRPPGTTTPTTTKKRATPSTVSTTTTVTMPATSPTTGTTRPVCPPPPVSPWTITAPGAYFVPIDGRAPRPVSFPNGLDPEGIAASPDGSRLVFSDRDPDGPNPYEYTYTIYAVDRDGSNLKSISNRQLPPGSILWSPDGRWIAWVEQVSGANLSAIYVMAPDGSQYKKLWTYPVPGNGIPRWSPDSSRIAAPSGNDGAGLWVVDRATGASVHVVKDAAGEVDWSPDGKRLAVALVDGSPPTMTGGPRKLFPTIVINADGTNRREIAAGYNPPFWSPAGDGIALRLGGLIDPDTLVRRSYGHGSAKAYAADGEHLLATGPGYLINDRRGCSFQLVASDFALTSPNFVGWVGNGELLVRVRPPA